MKINRQFLDEIAKRLDVVSAAGRSTLEQIMISAPDGYSFTQLYDYVLTHYLPIVETCASDAATLGANAYDTFRELEVGEAMGAMPYSAYDVDATTQAVRTFVGQSCDARDHSLLTDMLGRRLDSEVMRSYTNSQLINGEKDPMHPRFARVPSGPDPCEFCRALAGHGFFYHSAKSAGQDGRFNRFHDYCRCQVVPQFSAQAKQLEVAGYDPEVYAREWRENPTYFNRAHRGASGSYPRATVKKASAAMPEIKTPLLKEAPQPVKLPDKVFKGPWNQVDDMDNFLGALFDKGDYVGTCGEFFHKNGRLIPTRGMYQRTCGQIRGVLNRTHNVSSAVRYRRSAGAYVRINPLDGRGVSDLNVSRFLYALIECDTMPLDMQYAYIRALNLPTQAICTSGGKSIHAVVKIGAKDINEYRERVAQLYAECKAVGFDIDAHVKNPSRYMRLPGVYRGDGRQVLISTGEGAASWDDWLAWCEKTRP